MYIQKENMKTSQDGKIHSLYTCIQPEKPCETS